MTDADVVTFLAWALPQLGLRWAGYRRVRGQVVKRVRRRIAELGLADAFAYRERLEADAAEWQVLKSLSVVTISRFYRDRVVWDALAGQVIPAAADGAGGEDLRCWSIGCASGEEPYTMAIAWRLTAASRRPGPRLAILATDVDEHVLARAQAAEYARATLRELPAAWIERAFEQHGDVFRLRDAFRAGVELRRADVRSELPEGPFGLIFCRNSVCTYFEEELQRRILGAVISRLTQGGFLVIGRLERLPSGTGLVPWDAALGIYQRAAA